MSVRGREDVREREGYIVMEGSIGSMGIRKVVFACTQHHKKSHYSFNKILYHIIHLHRLSEPVGTR